MSAYSLPEKLETSGMTSNEKTGTRGTRPLSGVNEITYGINRLQATRQPRVPQRLRATKWLLRCCSIRNS
jgi:hypothetical protein